MTRRFITAVYVGSLGGFIFGYDLGALSAATESLRAHFHLVAWPFGLTVASSVWGTVCGSVLAGRWADRRDRRSLIALCSVLYLLGAVGVALPNSPGWVFVLAMRFLCGTAVGGFTVGCPLFLSEIAPAEVRGRIVGLFQVQVGAGVIVAFSFGAVSARFAAMDTAWRWVLGWGAVPALALSLLVRLLPQPLVQPSGGNAEGALVKGSAETVPAGEARQRLFRRGNVRLILLATSVAFFNQLSGVNILLLYLLEILGSAGIDLSLGHTDTVLISGLGLATTWAGTLFVDRLGRKLLLYIGAAGMAACLVCLGLTIPHHIRSAVYVCILVAYNAFFSFSQGTVVWVYLSELFPPGLRGVGQGYGAGVHWIINALLVSIFPLLQGSASVRVFYVFALMMVLQIVVIWLWYPETTGSALGSFGVSQGDGQELAK